MTQKITVIGAGLAGLTAAYRLQQKNYTVEIYEAHPRVGGRVHSVLIQNFENEYSVAELGGQNITDGGKAKNIHNLAKEFNLDLLDTYIDFNSLFYDGRHFVDDKVLLQQLNLNKDELDTKLAELAQTCDSMQEVLDKLLPATSILKRIFTFMLTGYEGSPPSLLSPYHNITTLKYMLLGGLAEVHEISEDNPTLHMQTFKNGNATLALKLAEKLKDHLHLNMILKKVSRNENNKILLEFQNKTQVVSDKVIFAMPASVYEDIIFSDNTIPKLQLDLIKKVQYGKNAKILVPVKYQALTHDSIVTDNMVSFFNSDKKLMNLYFINDDGSYSFKDTLFAQNLSILKQGYENLLFNELMPVIAKEEQLVHYKTPVAKSWIIDPFAKGSYSNYSVILKDKFDKLTSYKNLTIKEIFMPVEDQLFFIGEHTTILPEIGTMEAAVESGERIVKMF